MKVKSIIHNPLITILFIYNLRILINKSKFKIKLFINSIYIKILKQVIFIIKLANLNLIQNYAKI